MAEERHDSAEQEGAARSAAAAPIDPALRIAADSEEAREYFRKESIVAGKQSRLLDLQIKDLEREDRLRHWSLVIHHTSDLMKVTFEVALAFVALSAAIFLAAAVWNAAHDKGLVIEAFQVPNDFADRGLSGQVMANQLLDKLSAMQAATDTSAPAQSYAQGWGNDIKIQIPQTGMSIGEFKRELRAWLGNETHISGEVFRDGDRISVTARVGSASASTFSGGPGDLDALMQKAAEEIYRQTQPYRYAEYILKGVAQSDNKVWERARQTFQRLARSSDPNEQAWALVGLAQIARFHDRDTAATQADLREALALVPDHPLALSVSCARAMQTEHEEDALSLCRAASRKFGSGEPGVSPRLASAYKFIDDGNVAVLTGDFDAMRQGSRAAAANYGPNAIGAEDAKENDFISSAAQHDRGGMEKALVSLPPLATLDDQTRADRLWAIFYSHVLLRDWRSVVSSAPVVERAQLVGYPGADNDTQLAAGFTPWFALGKAMMGDGAGAERLIATTNLECINCLRVRGDIAASERRWGVANFWFADAAKQAPSIPAVYADWGEMLRAKGDVDGAIVKFSLAHEKGPHFADPLEGWGEALIAKNRSDLALAKFEEANKYAPNWGRLHLKWGEALLWSGKRDEARQQFAIASHLDLTPSEKSELARVSHG